MISSGLIPQSVQTALASVSSAGFAAVAAIAQSEKFEELAVRDGRELVRGHRTAGQSRYRRPPRDGPNYRLALVRIRS